jgi:hypothetical protein
MGSGDTIDGQIRVVLEDTQGNRTIVVGSLPQDKVDYTNDTKSPDERQYINTGRSSRVTAPDGAQKRDAPNAVFEAGERLIIQHKSSSDSGRSIDHDFDSFGLEGVSFDLNRNNGFTETLTVADQELTSDISESDEQFVDIYQFTVPDRQRYFLAGQLEAVGIEV